MRESGTSGAPRARCTATCDGECETQTPQEAIAVSAHDDEAITVAPASPPVPESAERRSAFANGALFAGIGLLMLGSGLTQSLLGVRATSDRKSVV